MLTPQKIYDATNSGLDVILLHFPEAKRSLDGKSKFKVREEATASASVKLVKRKNGETVYMLTDFGDDGRAKDPIAVHMEQTDLPFYEALIDLAQKFNISDGLNKSLNKPEMRREPAGNMPDGSVSFDFYDDFTEEQCKLMGPNVTADHLRALRWRVARSVDRVKDGMVTHRMSTDNFPIFVRECRFLDSSGAVDSFYKIYEPLNPEKGFRFSYAPKGKKQQSYVNGLFELKHEWEELNKRAQKEWDSNPLNDGKPYKQQKVKAVAICSGERDSVCALSMGMHPVWLNSETDTLTPENYAALTKYAEEVYNIPDVDETGIRRGTALAMMYPSIKTVWLPAEWLGTIKDNRGKPRKDLRDWMELRPGKSDFEKLTTAAMPAQFWTAKWDDKREMYKYTISPNVLRYFLMLKGFFNLVDERKGTKTLVQVSGSIVKAIQPSDVRYFVEEWAASEGLPLALRDLIAVTDLLSPARVEGLTRKTMDFCAHTRTSQWFFFENGAVEVSASGIKRHDLKKGLSGRYVWADKIIQHKFDDRAADMFVITHPEGRIAPGDFDITILDDNSNYFRYLINSSRIYWRKELETALADKSMEYAKEYRRIHKFDISGELLSDKERAEQKRCLISKIFTIGYLLHRFKSPSQSWASYCMDNLIDEEGKCNGGSGKSFLIAALSKLGLLSVVTIAARDKRLFENKHWTDQITKYTDLVYFDDAHKAFNVGDIYTYITGDFLVNPKNLGRFTLKHSESPKVAISTNYVPFEFDPSTIRRSLYSVTSDYYHSAGGDSSGAYHETRTIASDFGGDIMTEGTYPEEAWSGDITFALQCLRFYLSIAHYGIKIEPDLKNIIYRRHLLSMPANFRDWASSYFGPDSNNLDVYVVRRRAFDDYRRSTGLNNATMQSFSTALKSFCLTSDHIDALDPDELCNSGSRIVQKIKDPISGEVHTEQMIYIRSVSAAAEARKKADLDASSSKQSEMDF